jgi:hypothetical protein
LSDPSNILYDPANLRLRLALVMVELSSGRRLLAVPGPDELLIAF